uniref:Putative secreted protein n=1 Tax=Anopheles marajoara TaxID=58244 RepID=A0A2M4C9C1_9DIPT
MVAVLLFGCIPPVASTPSSSPEANGTGAGVASAGDLMSCGIIGRLNSVPVVLMSAFLAVVPSLTAKALLTLVLIKTIVEPVRAAAECCCCCWWCSCVTLL